MDWLTMTMHLMEKAREFLEKHTSSDEVSRLTFPPHRRLAECSFYECFGGRDVRLAVLQPDFMSCSFKVPPRLLDRDGNLAMGAISNLVDLLGSAVAYIGAKTKTIVSANMSISNISTAKLNDELEILARCVGRRQGGYSLTHILIRNKATGEIVAEGRHSLFDPRSKL